MNLTLLFTHQAGEPPVQSGPRVLPGTPEMAPKLDEAKQHLKWLGKSWGQPFNKEPSLIFVSLFPNKSAQDALLAVLL